MKLKIIACDVLFREISYWAAQSPHIIDTRFLRRELHNDPDDLRTEIQREVDAAEGYDAVVLGYGLCSNAGAYVRATKAPLVLPRGHDCITLFLGSRQRYDQSFGQDPGTYYYTTGWIERAGTRVERTTDDSDKSWDETYQDYVRRFGEDSAQFLMETLHTWWKHYTRAGFIGMGLPNRERFEARAREQAAEVAREYGWDFQELPGDQHLFASMVDGGWDDAEFLVAPVGTQIVPSYDEGVVRATTEHEPIPPRAKRILRVDNL